MDHGYFFDELSEGYYYVVSGSETVTSKINVYTGGDFFFDSTRRKVSICA